MYHAGLQRILLVAGSSQTQIWSWNGATWTLLGTGGPNPREKTAVVYDTARDRLVLFGGDRFANPYLGDTWEWDGSNWAQAAASGPSARANHVMAYDESRHRTVLYGGNDSQNVYTDTWEWDGQAWTQVGSNGPGPSSILTPCAYDPVRNLTLFLTNSSGSQGQLWEWDGAQWRMNPGSIPMFSSAWMAFDRSRSRVVIGQGDILDFEPVTGQLTVRQPTLSSSGDAAFDPSRSVTVIGSSRTLEFNGSGTDILPYVVTGLTNATYEPGSTITLAIEGGGTGPLTYRWDHNGQSLVDGGRISGATTPSLTINPATVLDSGSYSVSVYNHCAIASSGATIQVNPACYPNCDGSTTSPALNVNDFICFQTAFAMYLSYANCDRSLTPPMFNVNDFICFMVSYAAGCTAP